MSVVRREACAYDQNDPTKIGISGLQARKYASAMLAAAALVEDPKKL